MTLSKFKSLIGLRKLPYSKTQLVVFLILLLLVITCSYYKVGKVQTGDSINAASIENYGVNKYVILHSGGKTMHLASIVVDNNNQQLTAITKPVDADHTYYVASPGNSVFRYDKSKGNPTYEVHFYSNASLDMNENSAIVLPFSKLEKIEVYDAATGHSVFMTAAGVAGALVLVGVIVALTKSSCPFIYANDGENYVFQGELYPGAIRAKLERDDYLLLPSLKSKDGCYSIKVSNELKEIQYTNLLNLIEITHNNNFRVLLDNKGNAQTISHLNAPSKLIVNDLNADLKPFMENDDISYQFNDNMFNGDALNSVVLEFEKPKEVASAKLVLTARNSYWLDYMYGKFNEKLGTFFNEFQKNQESVSSAKSWQWMLEQGIPLGIYVKNSTGWKLVAYENVTGPLAKREIVVQIEFEKSGENKISIKLESGFMFWEIDYAGIDFSKNQPIQISYIKPKLAFNEDGNNVTNELVDADDKYLLQSKIGSVTTIDFVADESRTANTTTTVFLKNSGYYTYIRDYKGKPDFAELKTFRKKGAFTRFSKETYFQYVSNPNMLDLIVQSNE